MNKLLTPKDGWKRIFTFDLTYDIPLALLGCVGSLSLAHKFNIEVPPQTVLANLALVGGLITVLLLVAKAVNRHVTTSPASAACPLESILHALASILVEGPEAAPANHGLRLCIFTLRHDKKDCVHQITNYVGTEKPYGKGRDMSSRAGVVGKAARTGNAVYDSLKPSVSLVDYLMTTYGFTYAEAVAKKPDRKSWAAVPVVCDDKVLAVIFADCAQAKFWNATRRKTIQASVIGVVEFLDKA